jgi:hypothetical protein
MGIAANIVTAYLVARVKIQYLAVVSALITMIAPPLMATVEIGENYWFAPFWALFLSPVNPDGNSTRSLSDTSSPQHGTNDYLFSQSSSQSPTSSSQTLSPQRCNL